MGMESDESNLLDAVATILGLRGCHWNALARGCFLLFFFLFWKICVRFLLFFFFRACIPFGFRVGLNG